MRLVKDYGPVGEQVRWSLAIGGTLAILLQSLGCDVLQNVDLPDVGESCYVDRFQQPATRITNKVDLLFMVDSSSSLLDERQQIASALETLTGELPADTHFRIGVMVGHGKTSQYSGRLIKRGTEPRVLSSDTMSLSQILDKLLYKMESLPDDLATDGGEAGLYSLLRSFGSDRLALNQADGFFRTDAALVVVFVADENDICADYPAGVTPVRDGDNREGPAKIANCTLSDGKITPRYVVDKVRALKGNMPFLLSGILFNTHNYPRVGENEYGYGYIETIAEANGVTADLASGAYDEAMETIGGFTHDKLLLLQDFKLTRTGFDPSSLEVLVDGLSEDFSYNASRNEIHVPSPGHGYSFIDAIYCDFPVNPPDEEDPGEEDPGSGGGGSTGGGGSGGGGSGGGGDEEPPCVGIECGVIGV